MISGLSSTSRMRGTRRRSGKSPSPWSSWKREEEVTLNVAGGFIITTEGQTFILGDVAVLENIPGTKYGGAFLNPDWGPEPAINLLPSLPRRGLEPHLV